MIYCGIIQQDCHTCYELHVNSCISSFTIPCTNLTPSENYYVWTRDKANNLNRLVVTAESNGNLIVSTSDLPKGMFTVFFGNVEVFVSTDDTGVNIQPLTLGGLSYTCIIIKVQ